MREQGLVSVDYNTTTKAVLVVYEPDAEYDVDEIIAYVEDMTESGSRHVMVYEDKTLMHNMRYVSGRWVRIE